MKILLDENLPHDFRRELPGHDVFTVRYMGWHGLKNGHLLAAAADAGFDVLLTTDGSIPAQQNLASLRLAIGILKTPSNDIEDLVEIVPALLATLCNATAYRVVRSLRNRSHCLIDRDC